MLTTRPLYLHNLTIQLYGMCAGRDSYDWIEKTRRQNEVIVWRNEVYVVAMRVGYLSQRCRIDDL
jgi:hypothetical protein